MDWILGFVSVLRPRGARAPAGSATPAERPKMQGRGTGEATDRAVPEEGSRPLPAPRRLLFKAFSLSLPLSPLFSHSRSLSPPSTSSTRKLKWTQKTGEIRGTVLGCACV